MHLKSLIAKIDSFRMDQYPAQLVSAELAFDLGAINSTQYLEQKLEAADLLLAEIQATIKFHLNGHID